MQRRIDMLTRFEGDNPLAALAEIRYDRELGLMADRDAHHRLPGHFGRPVRLAARMGSSPESRHCLLRQSLPTPPLVDVRARHR